MVFVCHQQMIWIPFLTFLTISFSKIPKSKMAIKQLLLLLVVKYQVRHWQLHEKYCQIKQLVMKIFTLFSVFNALEIYVCLRTTTSNLNKHFWRRGGSFWGTLNVKELVLKKPMVHVVYLVDVAVQEAEFKKKKHIKKIDQYFLSFRTRQPIYKFLGGYHLQDKS